MHRLITPLIATLLLLFSPFSAEASVQAGTRPSSARSSSSAQQRPRISLERIRQRREGFLKRAEILRRAIESRRTGSPRYTPGIRPKLSKAAAAGLRKRLLARRQAARAHSRKPSRRHKPQAGRQRGARGSKAKGRSARGSKNGSHAGRGGKHGRKGHGKRR